MHGEPIDLSRNKKLRVVVPLLNTYRIRAWNVGFWVEEKSAVRGENLSDRSKKQRNLETDANQTHIGGRLKLSA